MSTYNMVQKFQQMPWAGHHLRPTNQYVIGDVHGCRRTLQTMVEELLCPEHGDVIILLGDYIDRGPDSKGVLDYLISLMLRDDIIVLPLRGNHEDLCIKAAAGDQVAEKIWFGNGGWGTLHHFGVARPEYIPKRYMDLMKSMPLIWTDSKYVLVHAGLDFDTNEPINDTSELIMLWERNPSVIPAKLDGRTIVYGHTMTPLFEIQSSLHKPAICLDNGCYDKGHLGYGSLLALNLATRDLLVQENCE